MEPNWGQQDPGGPQVGHMNLAICVSLLPKGLTGLCEGNSPVTGEFPTQRASNAEKVSIWWRRHDNNSLYTPTPPHIIPIKINFGLKKEWMKEWSNEWMYQLDPVLDYLVTNIKCYCYFVVGTFCALSVFHLSNLIISIFPI